MKSSILLFISFSVKVVFSFQTQSFIPFLSKLRGGDIPPKKVVHNGKISSHRSPAAMTSTDTPQEEWTPKRIHNTNWFRSGAILVALTAMGATQSSPIAKLPTQVGAVLHLLSFATWFGTMIYTTFILGITAFKNLPRQTFGKLQSKLFPKYFALGSICLLFQILTLGSVSLSFTNDKRVAWSLGSALVATLFNQFYMEPYTTKIMLERYDLENTKGGTDTDRYKQLRKQFGKTHGISSLTNLISLCGSIAYGLVLSSKLIA